MSRLEIQISNKTQGVVDGLYNDLTRRVAAAPPGICPIDLAASFLHLCRAQTCGKCVPCRVGLPQLEKLLQSVLDGTATMETLDLIEKTARTIVSTADCALGYEATIMVLRDLEVFREDYISHIENGHCLARDFIAVPCVEFCPAHVDIPAYIALAAEGRYDDAVKMIRKDNPFPTACAFICEHPCESHCRRTIIDDAINIRGLKRYAVDNAGSVATPDPMPPTGKTVAVIGGGPAGLTAAYFLALMGHKVTIFERQEKLGGMLRYGIPNYRFPKDRLDDDIRAILSVGIEVKTGYDVGLQEMQEIHEQFDAVYVAIGAHTDKKIGIEGEDAEGVISAVKMLRDIGQGKKPDFTGKRVLIVGGGNVAMDAARSSVRLGAKEVAIVYRRRQDDMTALPAEVKGAIEEGCAMLTLQAPRRIEKDENGKAVALWVQPQIIGLVDKSGRPRPNNSPDGETRIEADIIVVAIGQNIEYQPFEQFGMPVKWGCLIGETNTASPGLEGVFVGGDCESGPSTVIKAIAAGKIAAANIDEYLGFHHEISVDVQIPAASFADRPACGRVNMTEREASIRKEDFELAENGMTCAEASQESHRCLRCDHFGFGSFRGGRKAKW